MFVSEAENRNQQCYELVEYTKSLPFRIHNITDKTTWDEQGNIINILEHWHPEVEIVYTFIGNARHYIDGRVYRASPGKLFIVNSESIHKVMTDETVNSDQKEIAVVLNINNEFIKQIIPMMHEMYFVSDADLNMKEIGIIMKELSAYGDHQKELKPYEQLWLTGKVYELLYWICRDGLVLKEEVLPVNGQKNLERLRGIMEYVREHYTEPITQGEVACRFYFTREYFSRFFKKNTGLTFKEYLTRYRVNAAREDLLNTDKTILEIAVNHGFADARGFINAFKTIYKTTPLKYRKSVILQEQA